MEIGHLTKTKKIEKGIKMDSYDMQVKNVLTAIKYNTVEYYDEHGNYAPYVPLQFIVEEVENLKNIIKTEKE